jgi:hypothetical protein
MRTRRRTQAEQICARAIDVAKALTSRLISTVGPQSTPIDTVAMSFTGCCWLTDRSLVCLGYLGHEPPSISPGIMALSKGVLLRPRLDVGSFFPIRCVVARLILATTFVYRSHPDERPLFSIDLYFLSTFLLAPPMKTRRLVCSRNSACLRYLDKRPFISAHNEGSRGHVSKYEGIAGLL